MWYRRLTLHGAPQVGTPLYMAPELIETREYGPSADVWSYGVVLWELAAQQTPDILQQEGRVRGPMFGTLTALFAEGMRLEMQTAWPEPFRDLVSACWQQDPQARPQFKEILSLLATWVDKANGAETTSRDECAPRATS